MKTYTKQCKERLVSPPNIETSQGAGGAHQLMTRLVHRQHKKTRKEYEGRNEREKDGRGKTHTYSQ